MRRRSLVPEAIAALVLLFLVNLWVFPDVRLEWSSTSLGTGPTGYAAAFDLLEELRLGPRRSYRRIDEIGAGETPWFVWPDFLQSAAPGAREPLERWVASGGTAVLIGTVGSEWGGFPLASEPSEETTISGEWAPRVRELSEPVRVFSEVPEGARVRLRAGGAPFAVELPGGKGRIVAVADGRFLTNRQLDEADESLLLVDLAVAAGPPVFDERSHGLHPTPSLVALVAESRALVPVLLFVALAGMWLAYERRWPRRRLAEPEGPDPSLEAFVRSLGVLYARRRDPAAAFAAYREGLERRLRRAHHSPPPPGEAGEWLAGARAPRTAGELVEAVRALERWQEEKR